jgi:hypothetical protein
MTVEAADIASPGTATIDLLGAVPAGGLTGGLPLVVEPPAASPGASLVAAKNGSDLRLDWAAAGGASRYDVLRCASTAGACAPAPLAAPAVNTYLDPVLANPDSYWYLIEAVNSCGGTP